MVVKIANKPVTPLTLCTEKIEACNKVAVPPALTDAYNTCLNKYCTLHGITDPCTFYGIPGLSLRLLFFPRNTFFMKYNSLYCALYPYTDFTLPMHKLFSELQIPCSEDSIIETDLIYSLKQLVKSYSLVPNTIRRTVLYLSEHPNMATDFNDIVNMGILIDNNLYLPNTNLCYQFVYTQEQLKLFLI